MTNNTTLLTGSIRFAGDIPAPLVLAGALAAAFVVMWYYMRETRTLATPYSYLLPALRGSAVALVILVLAGPVWHRRQVIGTLGRVVFAIDTSASMSITDSANADESEARIRRATRLLAGTEAASGLIQQLSETHEVEVVTFDGENTVAVWSSSQPRSKDVDSRDSSLEASLESSLLISATGSRSDLSAPLRSSAFELITDPDASSGEDEDSDSEVRSAMVLMSDGRHNLGPSPVNAAQQMGATSMQVMTLGMGSEDEPADIGVVEIVRPDSVASDATLSGNVVLKQFGVSGKPISVRIEHLGETVWQRTVTPSTDGELEVPFEFEVEKLVEDAKNDAVRGVSRSAVALDLRAVVDSPEARDVVNPSGNPGVLSQNNAMSFRVAAATRDRRLLILDGSSRWETRYLRNLFVRDPAWSVEIILVGPETDNPVIVREGEPGEFPSTIEEMSVYDAVILGEVPPDLWKQSDAFLLRQFVQRGGGLVVVDGRYDRVRPMVEEFLSDVIPIKYREGASVAESNEIIPSSVALEHPMMRLRAAEEESESDVAAMWKVLPSPSFANRVEAQAGAEVWADVALERGGTTPWLVTRLYGSGRVFYFASDQTWRWRYKLADELHARFWNQVLSAVMQPPYSASDSFVAIGTDRVEYEAGDSSLLRVRLQDPSGKPMGDSIVDALLVRDDKLIATVPLSVDDPSRGTYQGQTPPLEAGEYEIRIRASGFDSSALQATTPIWVGTPDQVELSRVGLDKNALVEIAQAGGGKFFHESSADQLLETLKPLSRGSVIESDILLWQSFYWFWLVIFLLTVEWLLRKRAGLV